MEGSILIFIVETVDTVEAVDTGFIDLINRKFGNQEYLVLSGGQFAEIEADIVKYLSAARFLGVGYVMHFAPFFMMSRVLYFHHYFPGTYLRLS